MSPVDEDTDRPHVAIVASFGVSVAAAICFAAAYTLNWSTQVLGGALAVGFGGIAVGLTVWARHLTEQGGYVEEHEGFSSPSSQTDAAVEQLSEIAHPHRRGLLALLALAATSLGAAALFPLRSLMQPRGEHPARQLGRTVWRTGPIRLVDAEKRPVRIDDVTDETMITVFPEGHTEGGDVPAFVVRIAPSRFMSPPPGGTVDGVVAYSLLCTHAGCPVSMYEQSTGRMLCPCHQSVFDLLSGGRAVQGPAARGLPGLPIAVDEDGFLYGTDDFTGPPGAGYWSRP